MSAATRLLRDLAEEGIELGRGAVRWLENRFAVEETPENVARARRALSRVEPNVPARPRAADYVVRAQPQAAPPPRPQRRTQERSLAARPERPLAARPQPAAEQPLALPPPAEPLPSFAAKPRGGQWITRDAGSTGALSPEQQVLDSVYLTERYQSADPLSVALRDWWDKALPRYIRNDFGTPTDPLRELAPLAGMADSPDQWAETARMSILPFPISSITLPPDVASARGGLPGAGGMFSEERMAMPWLARQPATDSVYAVDFSRPDTAGRRFTHVADELRNAMRPEISGIPADLAVRPESLQRMSFPQAVERVGRINQWRAAQQAEASLAAQNNPALRVYREYAENNPRGLRWVEIAPPDAAEMFNLTPVEENGSQFWRATDPVTGETWPLGGTREQAVASLRYHTRDPLEDALRYEGDTMGHCVGGYCEDVLSGRTRIFSLRDAQGQPFVTVETRPRSRVFSDLVAHLGGDEAAAEDYLAQGFQARDAGVDNRSPLAHALELAGVPPTQDIIQIKGSGKRQGQQQLRLSSRGYEGGPDDYLLPFVQDFVRQGQWGNVGDLANTGLVRLPDGRYITQAQLNEATTAAQQRFPRVDAQTILADGRYQPEAWAADYGPYFEGYAIGGRVDPERCFTRHPLSVRR